MVVVVCERGFAGASVSAVCSHAGVSRSAFYECFEDREGCFLAVIDEGYLRVSSLLAGVFERARDWREALRVALAELLLLFDSEPRLARVWLVDTLAAGSWALERRAEHVRALTLEIVGRWSPPAGAGSHPLAAEGVMESLLGIVQTHALTAPDEPMIGLLGPLVGVAVAPYLDEAEVARDVALASAHARELLAAPCRERAGGSEPAGALLDPRAHRARMCLEYLAAHPGASNREVADGVGINSHAQVSALLSRLAAAGLLQKCAGRPGHANAWSLTPSASHALDAHALDASASHISRTPSGLTVTS